ncbi:MAG: ABC transporter ATP-binding protein [Clostridiaceae bacterium]|jgi:simple sugar transport system ATP-binding protein|nr:ABC transporter ATP-binding protein [Clostridiaceae bacterium]
MSKILEMINITKCFPGVMANDNVTLAVEAGEVHSLLGENGAGKSTLMNVLCGLYRPTFGSIRLDGEEVKFSSARDAMARGIGMVHQHFMLIPTMTVLDNCLIGAKDAGKFVLDRKTTAEKLTELIEKYDMKVDLNAKVGSLSVGQRQRVEIIKVLYRGARILILDEPTAVLTPQETLELFEMIRSLTEHNFTVLFISHKLNEVKEISDKVTVLRQGCVTGTYKTDDCSVEDLARLMVGREIDLSVKRAEREKGEILLDVKNLSLKNAEDQKRLLEDICFDVREGEILGVAGVDGNGQSELVECLTGMQVASSGEIVYKGQNLRKMKTREIMSNGISHIPQDRQKTGLIMPMTLVENFALQDYYREEFGKSVYLNWAAVTEHSKKLIKDFSIKTPSELELAQNLSGGNQQKVIIAREISRHPELLIAMHPTRGLDVGAIEYIHQQLVEQRNKGIGILLVSTELEEIMKLSDRIIVMYEGKIMGTVKPSDITIEEMGLMMGGQALESIRAKKAV